MGSAAMVRLTTARLLVVSTPVMECGYRKIAKAEPPSLYGMQTMATATTM
jgi:hypothetical protein